MSVTHWNDGAAGPRCRWGVLSSAPSWRWSHSVARECLAPVSRISRPHPRCTGILSSSISRTQIVEGRRIPRCCGVLNMTGPSPQSLKGSPSPPFRLTSRSSALSPVRLSEGSSSCRRWMGTSPMRVERSALARRRCDRSVPVSVPSSKSRCLRPQASDGPFRSGWSLRCHSPCSGTL